MGRNPTESVKRSTRLKHAAALARTTAVALVRLVGYSIRVLAGSAQATPTDDKLNSSIVGGVLNYRTGKLDDGTDPYGWYERD